MAIDKTASSFAGTPFLFEVEVGEIPEITSNYISTGRPNRPGLFINPTHITVNDGNTASTATAEYYGSYLNTDLAGTNSWHYTVDDKIIIQHLPTDEMSLFVTGSTSDPGNLATISITICRTGNRSKAEENATWLIRYLMALYAIPVSNVVPLQYWDGSNRPGLLLPRWDKFVTDIQSRDEQHDPDRPIFIFNKSEVVQAVLINGSPKACPYFNAVHLEQLNGENSLELSVPAGHEDAQYITEENLVAIKDLDEDFYQLFVIKEVEEIHDEVTYKRAYCEHAAFELADEIITDKRPENKMAREVLEDILAATRWQAGVVNSLGTCSTTFYYQSVLSAIHKMLEVWKCEVRYRVKLAGGKIVGRYVDLLARRGHETGRRFEYTRDMKKVTRKVDSTSIKTALYGRGKGEETDDGYGRRTTFADVVWSKAGGDPADKPAGQEWVGDPDALTAYGRPNGDRTFRHRTGIFEDQEETDPVTLLQKTWDALQKAKVPLVEFQMDVVDLEQTAGYSSEKVRLGDTVTAIDREFNPPLAVEARVIEIRRYLDEPEKAEIKLGNFIPKVTNTLARLEQVEKKVEEKEPYWDGKIGAVDGVLDTLRAQVRAGNGTVKLTSDQGILITDREINPTKALRLLGGIFAIANSKDPVTGEWLWTTFGTGDGFSADLIKTGYLFFDRAKGGTLTLGGADNGFGRLQVLNGSGEVIADLDSRVGGFKELYVGKLKGNVFNFSHETLKYYVNPATGKDSNPGVTPEQAFKTVQKAVNSIPKFNYGDVQIILADNSLIYENEILIEGFYGAGNIDIDFMGSTVHGYITVRANLQKAIKILKGKINQPTPYFENDFPDGSIQVFSSNRVEVGHMDVYSNSEVGACVHAEGSVVDCYYNKLYGGIDASIVATHGALVHLYGSNYGESPYGIKCIGPSTVAGRDVAPNGTTADTLSEADGEILGTLTFDPGTPAAQPAPPDTSVWEVKNIAVYNEYTAYSGIDTGGAAVQGEFKDWGNYTTFLFFNDADLTNLKATLSGKTLKAAYIYAARRAEGGVPTPEPLHLAMHNYTPATLPPGPPRVIYPVEGEREFAWSEAKWEEIPTWTIQAILEGNAKGFALYSEGRSNYAKFEPGFKIKVVYS
ncbi:phage-related protein [Pelotomaculum thermopropionicum SI]|uniref:N-acetylmuramoyl-L-alanine amidase n=1 Tax=Pelotomaculum thermopropionicum (strain DSM 13744 / JCM 10971 / SI) TaxID=370438 RepID=A5D093_PELTS|nr:phage-related protein [Pelotomaculum thermopropionicum SI]